MNKKLFVSDNGRSTDSVSLDRNYGTTARKTEVTLKTLSGDPILKQRNMVPIAGSEFTIFKHFDIPLDYITPSYNNVLGLDNIDTTLRATNSGEFVYLFAVGTGGCGELDSNVYPVEYSSWIKPQDLVPFRYQLSTADLSEDMRSIYYGRKTMGDNGRIAYYFKALEGNPIIKRQYIDGTPVDNGIYNSTKSMEVESYVELRGIITKEDLRDYFIATTGIESARINQISLLTAYKTVESGITYYQNIRPLTLLNIHNEQLIDLTKGIDMTYHIYY